MKLTLTFATMMIVAQTALGGWFSGEDTEPLTKAHEFFLKKDYGEMVRSLKRVFLDPKSDDVTKKNALALLDKAYEVKGDKIPVDWKLPDEISFLKVILRYMKAPNKETYALKVSGNQASKGLIKQIQIVQYPDKIVLDKAKKLGEWQEVVDDEDGPYFELDGPRSSKPVAEGLYLLNLELTNGKTTKGWFLLSDLVSSDTPVVHTPSAGQTFSTKTPTLKWNDFRSPEYKSHETRSLWLAVVKTGLPDDAWHEEWTMNEGDPVTTETTVGVDPKGTGVKALDEGSYHFYLSYKENRGFGDIRLGRQSVSRIPFHIRAK